MAEKGAAAGEGAAKRTLTAAETHALRRVQEVNYWKTNAARLRRRNLFTGLTIGAFVVGMFTYTILSVKQEKIMDELDSEAKIHIYRGPRTGANS